MQHWKILTEINSYWDKYTNIWNVVGEDIRYSDVTYGDIGIGQETQFHWPLVRVTQSMLNVRIPSVPRVPKGDVQLFAPVLGMSWCVIALCRNKGFCILQLQYKFIISSYCSACLGWNLKIELELGVSRKAKKNRLDQIFTVLRHWKNFYSFFYVYVF